MFKMDLKKAEEPEITLPIPFGSSKKQESSKKNIYFCFIDYAKGFDCVDHNKLWKILQSWKYQATWPASWEICMQVKKQQLELELKLNIQKTKIMASVRSWLVPSLHGELDGKQWEPFFFGLQNTADGDCSH